MDDDDAAHRFTIQGEGDDSVGDQIGLNQTAALLLLLVGQLLELVPGSDRGQSSAGLRS